MGNFVWQGFVTVGQDFVTVKKCTLGSTGNGQLNTRTRVILLWATPVGLRPNRTSPGIRKLHVNNNWEMQACKRQEFVWRLLDIQFAHPGVGFTALVSAYITVYRAYCTGLGFGSYSRSRYLSLGFGFQNNSWIKVEEMWHVDNNTN